MIRVCGAGAGGVAAVAGWTLTGGGEGGGSTLGFAVGGAAAWLTSNGAWAAVC